MKAITVMNVKIRSKESSTEPVLPNILRSLLTILTESQVKTFTSLKRKKILTIGISHEGVKMVLIIVRLSGRPFTLLALGGHTKVL